MTGSHLQLDQLELRSRRCHIGETTYCATNHWIRFLVSVCKAYEYGIQWDAISLNPGWSTSCCNLALVNNALA
ncbi:hypothetical protein HZ326_29891 [Fusarium oxysporum f. sp. albedinis]|nr:hypothetical protein HZ326_29891 [Fusarium oxysporum f. sp. albedinis]